MHFLVLSNSKIQNLCLVVVNASIEHSTIPVSICTYDISPEFWSLNYQTEFMFLYVVNC